MGPAPLAAIFLIALPLLAQSDNQHGVRSAQPQVAYLVKPVEVPLPAIETTDLREYTRRVTEIERAALANSGGAPIQVNLSNTPTVIAPSTPVPRLVFETWAERLPRDYQEGVFTGFSNFEWSPGRVVIHRFVRDNLRHVYVRYAIAADQQPGSYRLTFNSPAEPNPPDLLASENWKIVAPSRHPAPQLVEDGDTLALELYVDPKTGRRLVDYIHMLDQSPVHLREDPARDSYAEDAELQLDQAKLRVNGVALDPGATSETPHAGTLAVYLPDRGTYVLSLKPRPGFDLLGEVSGNSLYFSAGADLIRIDCRARIASTGSAAYNLYVRRDESATPPPDASHFVISEVSETP